jgi:hypothetical protein
MVKKLALISLSCLYLLLSVGIAKSTHFCMGREQNTSLFSFEAKKCPCFRSSAQTKSCCADEHKLVKIEDDQSTGQVIHSPIPEFNLIGDLFSETKEALLPLSEVQLTAELNPPPPKIPIYQTVCSLVFYELVV